MATADPIHAANRPVRLRHLALTEENRAALSKIKEVMCGWRGCTAFHSLDQSPDGWSNLICHETPPQKAIVRLGVGNGRPSWTLGAWPGGMTSRSVLSTPQKLAELLYCDPGADPLVSKTAGRA
jgi:hypothetical protein